MVTIKNKSVSRPDKIFLLERIQGVGYSVTDSKNSLTLEQKQISLGALSETGVARPEDSPFQCFYSYNDELDRIIINYLEDGIDGNVKCRQFWFKQSVKLKSNFVLKMIGLIISLGLMFSLGFFYVDILKRLSHQNDDKGFVLEIINCNDPEHKDFATAYKKIKAKILDSEKTVNTMIGFLDQKSLGISSKGEPQSVSPCISLREEVGNFSGTTKVEFKTNETGRFLELLKNLKDF